MKLYLNIIIAFICIVLLSGILTAIALFLRRRTIKLREKNLQSGNAPVVVTSATHVAPGGYPVSQMPVGATTQVYSTPYPPQGVPTHMPMPMPTAQPPAPGMQPYVAPYPTMPAENMNPPPYDVAVSGFGVGQQNNSSSGKQPPYNPNY